MARLASFHRSIPITTAAFCLIAAIAPLQGQSVGGPRASYLFHAVTRSLRPVVGIPGSSYLGPALATNLDTASISPDQRIALLVENGSLRSIADLQSGGSAMRDLDGALPAVDRILWSEDSTRAIVFSSTSLRLQWLTSFDGLEPAPAPLSLEGLGAGISLLAADSKALAAFVSAREAGSLERIYRIAPGAPPSLIATLEKPLSAAYDSARQSLYVVDAGTRQLYEIAAEGDGFRQTPLLDPAERINPAAVAIAPTGASLFLADEASRSLLVWTLAGKSVSERLPLDYLPSSFDPFGESGFLLTQRPAMAEPVSLLLTKTALSVIFIPAGDLN